MARNIARDARLVLAICLTACAPPFIVKDGFIRDRDGAAVILRGVNVSQDRKHAPYTDAHTDYGFVRRELGMNSVRLLVEWEALEPERGQYDHAYLASVAAEAKRASDAGLYVILDMHQDLFGDGFTGGNGAPRWVCDQARYDAFTPRMPWLLGYTDENVIACFDRFWRSQDLQAAYAAAWRVVAEAIPASVRVVGFDPMNEPHWGSNEPGDFEARTLAPFYARVIQAVRAARPHWLAFVEPASIRNLGISTALGKITADNVVYAPHLYDPAAETGAAFAADRRDAIIKNAAAMADEARQLGAALWIGEYGGRARGIAPYMDAVYDALSPFVVGSTYWHYGADDAYGILDRDGVPKDELLDAIVRPYPETTAGDPIRADYDEVTRVFTLEQTAADGVTVISVPERVYPGGVACEGCTVSEGRATFRGVHPRLRVAPAEL